MNYKLPYKGIFGGAVALDPTLFVLLNGFSNQFWGWGGEDDEMRNRVLEKGFEINREIPDVAR